MTRIMIRPIKGRGPPRERAVTTSGPRITREKSPEDIAKEREEVFKKSGCRRQYPDCPEIPDFNDTACHNCPHFPKKFR